MIEERKSSGKRSCTTAAVISKLNLYEKSGESLKAFFKISAEGNSPSIFLEKLYGFTEKIFNSAFVGIRNSQCHENLPGTTVFSETPLVFDTTTPTVPFFTLN